MSIINHNGELIKEENVKVGFNNRSFRYGDGFFESMKLYDGLVQFFDLHYQRIRNSLDTLWMDKPSTMSRDTFLQEVNNTIAANKIQNGKIKAIFYRKGKGMYKPKKNGCGFFIEIGKSKSKNYGSSKNGKRLGIYEDYRKPMHHLSRVKSNNALPFILAQAYAEAEGLDDVLILNAEGRICEASSSAVFIVIQDQIFTPPIREGGVDSTSRHIISNLAEKHQIPLMEEKLNVESLLNADEIFTANAVEGIQWISNFQGKTYKNRFSENLLRYWNSALETQE